MDNSNLGGFLAAHYRAVIGVAVAVILCCVVAIVGAAVSQRRAARAFVEIAVVPTTAVVTINGTQYRNGVYEMAPGSYTADVSQDGFGSEQVSVQATPGKTTRLEAILVNEKQGMAYFERSMADLNMLATLDDADARDFMADYARKTQIRKELPMEVVYELNGGDAINYELGRLEDGSGDPRCMLAFCLVATGDEGSMGAVREAVKEKGYDLNDYEVVYDLGI